MLSAVQLHTKTPKPSRDWIQSSSTLLAYLAVKRNKETDRLSDAGLCWLCNTFLLTVLFVQLYLMMLAGVTVGMAISSITRQAAWQPQNATEAFAAGGHNMQVTVRMKSAAAAGTFTSRVPAATRTRTHEQPPQQQQQQQQQPQPRQQKQHVMMEQKHQLHKKQQQQLQRSEHITKQVFEQAAPQQPSHLVQLTAQQGRSHEVPKQMVVATGADDSYFQGLVNFVGSVHYWCAECPIVVFNLGLSEEHKKTVDTWCNTTLKWRNGVNTKGIDSSHLTTPKQYAWKPFAILEAVNEYQADAVLWLDAGSTVTGPLMTTIWPFIRDDGHFFVQGQDLDMTRLCMQETFDYLKQRKEDFMNKPSYAGNTVGFVYGSEAYHKILVPWTKCAAVAECIAPPGSSTANHRFDQVVLSIITYTAGINVTQHTELLEASRLPCFVPNKRVVWTSRTGESCYTKYTVCSQGYKQEIL